MSADTRNPNTVAFGDFQTPGSLASEVSHLLYSLGHRPKAILEPSCGKGSFVHSASVQFPGAEVIIGMDINRSYVESAKANISDERVSFFEADFFKVDWSVVLQHSAGPWLFLGNPPWVTNSRMGTLTASNLPRKRNSSGLKGMDAITGKSNFDISEWMMLQYLQWFRPGDALAVLCKTTVARKVLLHAWKSGLPVSEGKIFGIDASRHFDANVDACLFTLTARADSPEPTCEVYKTLSASVPMNTLSFIDGQVITKASAYRQGRHLLGGTVEYLWRSGIKHDCSKILELYESGDHYRNGLDAEVDLEETYLFPLQKSSDLGKTPKARRMLVTQSLVGEDNRRLSMTAPRTWSYLREHAAWFRKRASSIYRDKGEFAIFGVGPYTFMPWKVATSGLYKRLEFFVVGPVEGKPVVFDDTVYFISCRSREEAELMAHLLNSEVAKTLLDSMIHWDSMRPITAELLRKLSLRRVASELGLSRQYQEIAGSLDTVARTFDQLQLFTPA